MHKLSLIYFILGMDSDLEIIAGTALVAVDAQRKKRTKMDRKIWHQWPLRKCVRKGMDF